MFKVNNKDTRTTVNFFSVSIVNFEYVIAGWVTILLLSTSHVFSPSWANNWYEERYPK